MRVFARSLRSRLMLPMLVAIVPATALVIVTARAWRAHELADATCAALQVGRQTAVVHARALRHARQTLAAVAAALVADPTRAIDRDRQHVLRAAAGDFALFDSIGIVEPDGRIVDVVGPLDWDTEVRVRALAAASSARVRVGHPDEYVIDSHSNRIHALVAAPVPAQPLTVPRVVFATVELVWLRDPTSLGALPAGSAITVLDGSARVLARVADPAATVDRGDATTVRVVLTSAGDVGTAAAVQPATRTGAADPRAAATLGDDLEMVIRMPNAAATAAADRLIEQTAVWLLFSCVFAAGVAWISSGHFTRQVGALVDTTQRLTGGDLAARTDFGDGMPELTRLARSIDDMAEALSARECEILARHDERVARERSFRAVLERGVDRVVLVDRAGTLLYTSPTGDASGYRVDELIGHAPVELVHEEDRDNVSAVLADVSATPGHTAEATFRARAKSGEWRWIRAELSNMLDDPHVSAIVGKYRDVTDARLQRRRASDRLQRRIEEGTAALSAANERLTRLSRAIEQTADSVFITDRGGVIEYVNPAFEQMTGYTSGEVIGSTPRIIASGRHDGRFYAGLWETILAGRVFRAVVTNRHKDGRLFTEDQSITPIRDADGAITHFISTGRDITERIRTEAALRRLNAAFEEEAARIASVLHDEAGQFLSSAHITLADVSRDLAPDRQARIQEVRHHLDLAEQQLRRVSHELHPRMLEDLGLVEAVRFLANGFARRTGISVDLDVSFASSCSRSIETVLYRLVQEGLANIGKHARASHVSLSVVADEAHVVCSIRDDGIGFDVDRAIEERQSFSLGLALMRDRVEAVGGTLTIVSGAQRGTELRALVPIEA